MAGYIFFLVSFPFIAAYALHMWGGPLLMWSGIGATALVVVYKIHLKLERKRAARKSAEDREAKYRSDQEAAEQRALAAQRQKIVDAREAVAKSIEHSRASALELYSHVPNCLLDAEHYLDQAQTDFNESAFSPFWQSVESALKRIADADDRMKSIELFAKKYHDSVLISEDPVEPFPIDVDDVKRLKASSSTEQRLKQMVRAAQRNFQYATIYEQRRNTSVLIPGFKTLGEAIDGLGAQLSYSLDSLTNSVNQLVENQRDSHHELVSSLSDMASASREAAAAVQDQQSQNAASTLKQLEHYSKQAESTQRQLAMLDNIQRRRSPNEDERGPRSIIEH